MLRPRVEDAAYSHDVECAVVVRWSHSCRTKVQKVEARGTSGSRRMVKSTYALTAHGWSI